MINGPKSETKHEKEYIPQSIVDGWQVVCTCGFKAFESFGWDNKSGYKERLFERLDAKCSEHLPGGMVDE